MRLEYDGALLLRVHRRFFDLSPLLRRDAELRRKATRARTTNDDVAIRRWRVPRQDQPTDRSAP